MPVHLTSSTTDPVLHTIKCYRQALKLEAWRVYTIGNLGDIGGIAWWGWDWDWDSAVQLLRYSFSLTHITVSRTCTKLILDNVLYEEKKRSRERENYLGDMFCMLISNFLHEVLKFETLFPFFPHSTQFFDGLLWWKKLDSWERKLSQKFERSVLHINIEFRVGFYMKIASLKPFPTFNICFSGWRYVCTSQQPI